MQYLFAGGFVDLGHLRKVLGEDVLVRHRQNRQLQADHAPNLTTPKASRIDDMLAVNRVELFAGRGADRVHLPTAIGGSVHRAGPRVSVDLGAGLSGRLGVRVGYAGRVDVALVSVPHRADEILLVEDRMDLFGLSDRDQLGVHAEVTALGVGGFQPVITLRCVGEHDAAGDVNATVPTGHLLDLFVELDRVLLQLGDVRVTVERVHATGRMPGRSGGQFSALQQDNICPTVLRQVIENRRPHDAAADHYNLCTRLHGESVITAAISGRIARRR